MNDRSRCRVEENRFFFHQVRLFVRHSPEIDDMRKYYVDVCGKVLPLWPGVEMGNLSRTCERFAVTPGDADLILKR